MKTNDVNQDDIGKYPILAHTELQQNRLIVYTVHECNVCIHYYRSVSHFQQSLYYYEMLFHIFSFNCF